MVIIYYLKVYYNCFCVVIKYDISLWSYDEAGIIFLPVLKFPVGKGTIASMLRIYHIQSTKITIKTI